MNTRRPRKSKLSDTVRRMLALHASALAEAVKRDSQLSVVLQDNPAEFRSRLLHALKEQFPLKLGRPGDPLIDAAYRLHRDKGKSISEVLRDQISDWDKLDSYTRLLAQKGLHQAIARREKREPRKGGR